MPSIISDCVYGNLYNIVLSLGQKAQVRYRHLEYFILALGIIPPQVSVVLVLILTALGYLVSPALGF